ncbi:MAG: hypothetical protein IJ717_05395 [Treponema sp.]|nr:hypothetical protein [Treponema sp.]
MKFIKATAILAGLVMAGAFSSCSNLDESDSGTISLTLPGSSERAATSSATAKENFLNSLVYEVYLTKDTTKSLDTENSKVDNFFQAVAALLESLGSIQKQTGKAGDTISFRDIDEGDYNVYLCYKSGGDYSAFGYDTKTISVKNGMQSRVKFEFDYPDSVKFDGYKEIADGTGLKEAVADLSTDDVEYPDEDTYTKFYLTSDITIGGNTPISISSSENNSYGIVLDLNGHTISLDDGENALSVESNVNIIIRNGTIAPGVTQFLNLDADATVELDGITVKTGDSEDEENTTFLSVNSGTVVATGGSSLTNVSVNGGIFIMLGGSVENVSQSNGSLALVEEWTATNGVTKTKKTFTATGANRITTYTPSANYDNSNWIQIYFGGDSKIESTIDAQSVSSVLKFMQVSTCKSNKFCTISPAVATNSNPAMLLTKNTEATFTLQEPTKSAFQLESSAASTSQQTLTWSSSTTESDSGKLIGYYPTSGS